MNDAIATLISKHASERSFSRSAPTEEAIALCQAELGVALSDQYVEFLRTYGQGGFNGVNVLGFSRAGGPTFVRETVECRRHGLPISLVAIEDCDEWVYCEDSADGSVVSWSADGSLNREYDCFDDYLLDRLSDAAENL